MLVTILFFVFCFVITKECTTDVQQCEVIVKLIFIAKFTLFLNKIDLIELHLLITVKSCRLTVYSSFLLTTNT